eukprot:CAMPEP_0119566268 /NCGR_PEP_ID=MMETSP1352-20130426/32582_1 /TAXON_ID=265584 /ORGANISM="Stauroneis constricta, Strain CCMP1120" /LENGTH=285 /DNA_ID=CAMNT_0007615339 /DNA_START=404 /DNA_END=1261 /DNA_ORIENTATION=+
MGCSSSTLQQTSVTTSESYVPAVKELTQPILKLPGEPSLLLYDEHDVSSSEQIRFAIQKTSRNHTGDSFRVAAGHGGASVRKWNPGKHLIVEPIYKFGGPRMSLEGTTGVFQGDEAVPVAYWTCDVARGRNHYKILREQPVYKQQARAFTISGRDQKDIPVKTATPFVDRTTVDFYSYANIVFDKETNIALIKVYGAPKCKGGVPLYQMQQVTSANWLLYRYKYDEERYKVCAMFTKAKGKIKEHPIYDTTISPGIDPIFVLCIGSILDSYWNYILKKNKRRLFR